MKKIIYGVAVVVLSVCIGIYFPKVVAYAQDKVEQREINKQVLDLELEGEDLSSQWLIFDDQIKEKEAKIAELSGEIVELRQQQDDLHKSAEVLRNKISQLKGEKTLNETIMNCYEFEGELYNDCLDAVISTGLM